VTPGIAVALAAELRSLTTQVIAPGSCARLPGGGLVALGGVGPERARAAALRLLEAGATALVSWGIAAGLDPRLRAGSFLLPERVIGADDTTYRVTASWRAELSARIAPRLAPHAGPLVEVTRLLETAQEKRALFERHGAIAADMESAALARVAAARGVPCVVLRVVADPAAGRTPAWVAALVDGAGKVRASHALREAVAHPRDWRALVALALQFRTARRVLQRVAPLLLSGTT
jgi:adenosylhomocysteine nucleosidase